MRKILTVIFVTITSYNTATAQKGLQLTKESIVKDSSGTILPYDIWARLVFTGRYKINPPEKGNGGFVIYRLSDEDYVKNLESMPKPKETECFKTGKNLTHFKISDINGNKINTKNLAGKIIVLNFWFINCPPCRMEIPELNKIADNYKSDSSIVFLAIALDKKNELMEFLKGVDFKYTVIDNGRYLADQYRISMYPTNLVIDPKGKIYFHTSGLAVNTAYWIKKSIDQLKEKQGNKVALAR